MTVRRIDPETGDIITSGRQFITGRNSQEEIRQTIITRLRLFSGEYFRNINDGTPWFQVILEKRTTNEAREAVLRRRLIETPGVLQLVEFQSDFDIDSRKLTVTAEVLTEHGLVSIRTNEEIR